jgi:hypothetical protein
VSGLHDRMPADPFGPMELAQVRWDELIRLAVFGGRSRLLRAVAALSADELRCAVLAMKVGALGEAGDVGEPTGGAHPAAAPDPRWVRLDSACEEGGVEGLLGAVASLTHNEAAALIVGLISRAVTRAERRHERAPAHDGDEA